jgi:hypothetical protein
VIEALSVCAGLFTPGGSPLCGDFSAIQPSPLQSSLLPPVLVRLILPGERSRWDALMRQHHDLGFAGMVGESFRVHDNS